MIKLSLEVGYDNKYDHHAVNMKSVGVTWDEVNSNDCGLLPFFNKGLMPLIKLLRAKVELYDKFKCRAIDIALMVDSVIECCLELAEKNPVICQVLKLKGRMDK